MRILFFDTETNGLPRQKNSTVATDWPPVVQLAWQVWDAAADPPVCISNISHIVKPDPSLVWDLGSQVFHTISKERALSEGAEPDKVFAAFRTALESSTVVVAHNIAFDKPVLSMEAIRRGYPPLSWSAQECCTMMASREFCRLPSMYSRPSDPYKYPKLSELHAILFGNNSGIVFHDAAADVDCTVRCFFRLVELAVIPLDALRVAGAPL